MHLPNRVEGDFMNIKILKNKTAAEFLEVNETKLIENEARYNIIYGIARSILKDPDFGDDRRFYTIYRDSIVVGQALRSHTNKPFVMSDLKSDLIDELISHLITERVKINHINGPVNTAKVFRDQWIFKNNSYSSFDTRAKLGIYQLETLVMPDTMGLVLEQCNLDDLSNIAHFMAGFMIDAKLVNEEKPSEATLETAKATAERHIRNGAMHKLVSSSGETISIAANTRSTKNVANISCVYTPRLHRNNGYGSIVTALLSQKMQDKGYAYCSLYTDLENLTSNSIYQRLGYKKIGEAREYCFK